MKGRGSAVDTLFIQYTETKHHQYGSDLYTSTTEVAAIKKTLHSENTLHIKCTFHYQNS